MKPQVYLETSIFSYLVGRLSRHDLHVASNQEFTREWWSNHRHHFELFASAVVVRESREGDPNLAAARFELVKEVNLVEVTSQAEDLQQELLRRAALPRKAELDALHIAAAAVHGLDYLLSWNCRHIANAFALPRVYDVCRSLGYEPPLVCTPPELMGDNHDRRSDCRGAPSNP